MSSFIETYQYLFEPSQCMHNVCSFFVISSYHFNESTILRLHIRKQIGLMFFFSWFFRHIIVRTDTIVETLDKAKKPIAKNATEPTFMTEPIECDYDIDIGIKHRMESNPKQATQSFGIC